MQRVLEEIAQIKPDGRADQRPEQRARSADRRLHDELAGGVEHEGVGRHETLHEGEQPAGETGVSGGHDEGGQLVAMDVVAERGGAQRVVAQRAQDRPDRGAHDTQRDHEADEIPERQKHVDRPVALEIERREAEVDARRRHARQAVLAAGVVRQRVELDEEEHFRDGDRDHREIDAGAPERDEADQIADDSRNHGADEDRRENIGKIDLGQEIGGEHAARAEERRLSEREKARVAEQDVEAEAEQAPDQDAVDRRRREAEMGQHERRGDQPESREGLDQEGALGVHLQASVIRGPPRREGRKAGTPGPASSPRTA